MANRLWFLQLLETRLALCVFVYSSRAASDLSAFWRFSHIKPAYQKADAKYYDKFISALHKASPFGSLSGTYAGLMIPRVGFSFRVHLWSSMFFNVRMSRESFEAVRVLACS